MFMLNHSRNSKLTIVLSIVFAITALFTLATAPSSAITPAAADAANDFYQRHPDWTRVRFDEAVVIPVTGSKDLSDYFLRHPKLLMSTGPEIDLLDYFFRHPALSAPEKSLDLSDYLLRHPELKSQ